jgi:hypothetical protein
MHARLTCSLRAQSGIALGTSSPAQRISLATNGVRTFLGRTHRQPSLYLGRSRSLGRRRRFLSVDGFGFERRLLLRVVQPLLELGEFVDRFIAARLELVALPDQPLPFVIGGAGVLP